MKTLPSLTPLQTTLYKSIGAEPITWQALSDAVEAEHTIRKGGWMAVRGALQELIKAHLVVRVPSVHHESYVRVKP